MMTAIELFLNANYYAEHPLFLCLSQQYAQHFPVYQNILFFCLSNKSIDSEKSKAAVVQEEAMNIC